MLGCDLKHHRRESFKTRTIQFSDHKEMNVFWKKM